MFSKYGIGLSWYFGWRFHVMRTPVSYLSNAHGPVPTGSDFTWSLLIVSTGMNQIPWSEAAPFTRNGAVGSFSVILIVVSFGASIEVTMLLKRAALIALPLKKSQVARKSWAVAARPFIGALSWKVMFGFRLKTYVTSSGCSGSSEAMSPSSWVKSVTPISGPLAPRSRRL